ncbi:MAG: ATP-binding protein [Endomicrobium sp.]|uniref:ATP-binding protein n=1 Tax=Candidatus Endomicrobiellum cubanum TaxID=3242325 RepID=UPI0028251E46|nr:ATP-binding protein [Endomicrobium sp.]
MLLKRELQDIIEKWLFKDKIVLIYGARQVGKTTLCKQILKKYSTTKKTAYFNCESLEVKTAFETTSKNLLCMALDNKELVVLDEAQNINNIGLTLKIIHDVFPNICVIASGSSSFDLINQVGAPLTGRSVPFILYPFSVKEIKNNFGFTETIGKLNEMLLTGAYPSILGISESLAQESLSIMAGNYLYKDVLTFEKLKNSNKLLELLQLLALQIGKEVSYSEIGQRLGMSHSTVSKYIDLLEKCFIIFKLRSFSKNPRKEISKSIKIFFYDLGIRNALIQTFTPLNLRTDIGALWENFCIVERKKLNNNLQKRVNQFFYRTFTGEEIDYIEEYNGTMEGYEFKYSKYKIKQPKKFISNHALSDIKCINKGNWFEFLI